MSKLIQLPANNNTTITLNVDGVAYFRKWGKRSRYTYGTMLRVYDVLQYKSINGNGDDVMAKIIADYPTTKFITVQNDYVPSDGQTYDQNVSINQENIFAIYTDTHDAEMYTAIMLTTGFIVWSDTPIQTILSALDTSPNPMKYVLTECFIHGVSQPTIPVYLVAGGISDYQKEAIPTEPYRIFTKYNQMVLTNTPKQTIDSGLAVKT